MNINIIDLSSQNLITNKSISFDFTIINSTLLSVFYYSNSYFLLTNH
jgi:hypothetical protein